MNNLHTLSDRILVSTALDVASITAASNNGTGIDCRGYTRAAFVVLRNPSGAATTSDVKLQESTDNSSFSDVSGGTLTQITTGDANDGKTQILEVDLRKRSRYLRLVHTGAGGSAAGHVAGLAFLWAGQAVKPSQEMTPVSV